MHVILLGNMPRTRYKPTFLLRCVVFVFVIAVGLGVIALANSGRIGLPLHFALGFGLVLVLSSDLISTGIVALLTQHAERTKEQSSPFWFVDSEQTKQLEAKKFQEDTKDNPTLH